MRFRSSFIRTEDPQEAGVADRQDKLDGFDTRVLTRAGVLLIGAGGLGGEIARGLARKGIGSTHICDHDVVEVSNLNRQHFYECDLYQPKAICLAKNAAREGHLGGECVGHDVGFDETSAEVLALGIDVAVVGVDHNSTRAFAARFFRSRRIPVVFTAINESSDYGWVFVQEVSGPCVGCVFPRMAAALGGREPCRPSPAVLDILRVVSGFVLRAVDTLILPRERRWNFRDVNLVGGNPDCVVTTGQRPGCSLCGAQGETDAA